MNTYLSLVPDAGNSLAGETNPFFTGAREPLNIVYYENMQFFLEYKAARANINCLPVRQWLSISRYI